MMSRQAFFFIAADLAHAGVGAGGFVVILIPDVSANGTLFPMKVFIRFENIGVSFRFGLVAAIVTVKPVTVAVIVQMIMISTPVFLFADEAAMDAFITIGPVTVLIMVAGNAVTLIAADLAHAGGGAGGRMGAVAFAMPAYSTFFPVIVFIEFRNVGVRFGLGLVAAIAAINPVAIIVRCQMFFAPALLFADRATIDALIAISPIAVLSMDNMHVFVFVATGCAHAGVGAGGFVGVLGIVLNDAAFGALPPVRVVIIQEDVFVMWS